MKTTIFQGINLYRESKTSKAISVTDNAHPQGCEMASLPHFIDSQLTDGSEVVSLTHQLSFNPSPKKIPGTHVC
jgi:hypothetical protein